MSKKNIRNNLHKMATTLGSETIFAGIMRFTDSLQINGNLEGEIISTGTLYIEESAEMIRDPKTVDIFSAKVDKLKKTVGGV